MMKSLQTQLSCLFCPACGLSHLRTSGLRQFHLKSLQLCDSSLRLFLCLRDVKVRLAQCFFVLDPLGLGLLLQQGGLLGCSCDYDLSCTHDCRIIQPRRHVVYLAIFSLLATVESLGPNSRIQCTALRPPTSGQLPAFSCGMRDGTISQLQRADAGHADGRRVGPHDEHDGSEHAASECMPLVVPGRTAVPCWCVHASLRTNWSTRCHGLVCKAGTRA